MKRKLALLDRDGTLIEHVHYLSDPEQVRLLPGVAEGLRALRELGYALAMVSNQSGVGRGLFSAERVDEVNARLAELLAQGGVRLDELLFCPHHPDEGCRCRKPGPAMAEEAARRLGGDLPRSIVVGDSDCDMLLAQAIGARGFRVGGLVPPGDFAVPDMPAVARLLSGSLHES
jgi:D-glycero-D-manno-heptose 1,7-bisphosphate phosphatase